ncbi:MAG: hypothetical protein ISR50_20560 [Alphaproteobacteria bacterium]|nr:hypothetical protein [Alphaproteobacteria bacterium]
MDFDLFHEIIGIEILNLKHIAGEHCLDQIEQVIDSSGQNLSSTYDPDSDSFYLQISDELSTEQQAVDGLLIINNIGNILGFKADLPS